jgi:hypothetical protein
MIWRIVELKNNMTLHDLHRVIQVSMDWSNAHLYCFRRKTAGHTVEYILPEFESTDEPYLGNNPKAYKLKELFTNAGDEMEYIYDFGSDWRLAVIFKGRRYEKSTFGFPACIGGAMACPPEDIGGLPGFNMLLEAIRNKDKPQLAQYKEWLGYTYDPYDFSPVRLIFLGKMIRHIK